MGAKKTDGAEAAREPQSFEQAMERLEAIVKEMEAGSLPLDTMIGRFEEGQGLIQYCSKKLNEVERRIEKLVKKGDQTEEVPLDAGEPDGGKDEQPF
jgi:exodeoxyribonuclease VII small subunit